jgi:hypothetical protein
VANLLYPKGKEAFLSGAIDLTTNDIRAVLVDTGTYTYNAAHDAYNDLSGVVGSESGVFGSKTVTDGVFDAADIAFTAVTGSEAEALVIFQDTGNPATDRLIAYIDTVAAGLPVTPNGGNINVTWNASGIFAL